MENFAQQLSFEGKRVLVTGGTSGLGHAIATAFLAQRADVAVCARKPYLADDLANLAKKNGSKFQAYSCDITQEGHVQAMVQEISKDFGNVDILVNSAGMNILAKAEEYSQEQFVQVMNLNVTGTHLVTKAIGKEFMIPQQYGRIVNLSSVKGTLGTTADYAAYCASKGAINMYTKQIAAEWGKYGITCNAVSPTFVRTPLNSAQLDDEAFYQELVERIPLGRIGKEEDVIAAVLFLASDAAKFISGQNLHVDGGLTARQ